MKFNLVSAIIFLMITLVYTSKAQTSGHPTVEKIDIRYKFLPDSGSDTILAIPEAIILLKTAVNISRIYFTIQNPVNNAVLYSVNYPVASPVIIHNGAKLFENNNGSLFISPGQPFNLRPYTIKVQTSDTLQNQSIIFSSMQ